MITLVVFPLSARAMRGYYLLVMFLPAGLLSLAAAGMEGTAPASKAKAIIW